MSIFRVCRSNWPTARVRYRATLALRQAPGAQMAPEVDAEQGAQTPVAAHMNWDRVSDDWKQLSGMAKEKWGKLTDDDITQINGNREQLEGKIQARYGYAKDQVRKDVDDWLGRM